MSLYMTDGPVPKGAVQLSRQEALNHQWKRIQNWPKQSQVWPYQWGIGFMGLLSSATGMHINNFYRRKLKIRHQGFISSLLPLFFAPPILSTFSHIHLVTSDILLHTAKCPLCLNTKAAILQVTTGIAYPIVIGSVINIMIAFQYATYRIPYWKDGSGHLRLCLELMRPLGKRLLPIAFAHILVAGFITYAEVDSLCSIDEKTRRQENETKEIPACDEM